MHIQISIDSRNSAIQHVYHTLLHPSSSSQPRHPMLKIVLVIAHGNITLQTPSTYYNVRYAEMLPQAKVNPPAGVKHLFRFFVTFKPSHQCCQGRKPMWHMAANKFTSSIHTIVIRWCANDPSAGSPTETLLRLLLPLSDKVH